MFIRATLFFLLVALLPLSRTRTGATRAEDPVTTIALKAVAGLRFDQVRFSVKPGAKVRIIFRNQDDMSHNVVFTRPMARQGVVNAALKLEEKGPGMNYIPKSDDVLWSIPVLSPGEEKSVAFTAPKDPGVYPYVCTFPGHGYYMYGAMYVTTEDKLPPLETDPNVPPRASASTASGEGHHAAMKSHPYELKPPYVYRAYMEDSGPASIAVHLPHQLSYCWDATTCELRYAWEGDFVDNSGIWKGKPNAVAKVLGTVFYRSKTEQPLRIGNPKARPAVEYKGYRLIDRYPEFHYTLNGVDVYEIIRASEDGSGLARTFRILQTDKHVWLVTHPDDGVDYEASHGKLKNNMIMLSPEESKNFRIIMTKKGTEK